MFFQNTTQKRSSLASKYIMKRILIIFSLLSSFLYANEIVKSPENVIRDFFYHFNSMNIEKINELWDIPIVYFVGQEIRVGKSYSEIVNYENLKKGGWSYSKINSIEPVLVQNDFAIYKTNFTRFNDRDIEVLSSDTNLTLIKKNNIWKLKVAVIPINIPTGK